MIILKTASAIQDKVMNFRKNGMKIGFVPTMGALHEGHISLIEQAIKSNDITVCSIFVNPTQFNNPEDFNKYPSTIENDIDMLEAAGCDIVYIPSVEEIYPKDFVQPHYDLGDLETKLEGKYRPGHFQGVCMVVEILLRSIPCHILYLGQKDYQQCMVIEKMIQLTGLDVQLVICPTVREANGLAMSSRNRRLSEAEKTNALVIFESMQIIKNQLHSEVIDKLIQDATERLARHGFQIDYIALTDRTLHDIQVWNGADAVVVLIAATINQVRLIDNMTID